jgi:hypothetical protein
MHNDTRGRDETKKKEVAEGHEAQATSRRRQGGEMKRRKKKWPKGMNESPKPEA